MNTLNLLELVMIVKNSGNVLRECLRSIKPYISKWTILDTGSTDNTPEIIKDELDGVPGSLFFEDFVDFSTSRNRSLDLACSHGIQCDYQIILDDSYVLMNGDNLIKSLCNSSSKIFSIIIKDENNEYYSTRILKTSQKFRYTGKIHEIIHVPQDLLESVENTIAKHLSGNSVYIKDLRVFEHIIRTRNRVNKDILLLTEDLKKNENDQRTLFHLAKACTGKESLKYLEKMLKIKNLEREYEFYAKSSIILHKYFNKVHESDFLNEKTLYKKMYDLSVKFPERTIECLYQNARIIYEKGDFTLLMSLLERLVLIKEPVLYITRMPILIYRYYIPYLYVNCLLKFGQIDKAVEKLKNLLEEFPDSQPLLNIKHSICENNIIPIILHDKAIVIHTGTYHVPWDPKNPTAYSVSGSEYMAMNVAAEFSKIGWRVFIFGRFLDSDQNFECVKNNVQYIDATKFTEFYTKYRINVLIVSRFLQNLVYHDNIEKVYLWIHDTLPISQDYIFQTHPTKFKGVIVLSKWHQQDFKRESGISDKNIILSRNAIYPERFEKQVSKIPFRFIYSADYFRGLPKLIEMIQKIKKIFPETTLKLFTDISLIAPDTLSTIKKLEYVSINPRVSQERISNEYLESDIWLYPTNFKETYCITALEAMCAGCLVACTGVAGLVDTVGDRGIMVKSCSDDLEDYDSICDELLKKLVFVLKNPELKNYYTSKAREWAMTQTYESLVKEWTVLFDK